MNWNKRWRGLWKATSANGKPRSVARSVWRCFVHISIVMRRMRRLPARLYAGNRSWLNLHPGAVSHYRQNPGRRYAPLMQSLSRRVLAHVWEMCKLHYSALGRRFMPLITLNPVALRRCYRAVFWGMCRVSRLLSRRCINNVFVCAMAASMTAENRRYAPGR